VSEKRRAFSTLLRGSPTQAAPQGAASSREATRQAAWRRIFDERGLVWAPHNLITPSAAAFVEAETRRVENGGAAPAHVSTSRAALPRATCDALIAQAESFLARGAIPAVELRPSGLPVGFGLFAADELAAGELIGEYTGLVCPLDDVEERGAYAYEAWPGSPLAIDACTAGNHTRFVNHAGDPNIDVVQCVVANTWHVLYAARRTIAAGEELFVDYGDEYWRRRRLIES
jgi:uncharacterized protein